MRRPGKISVDNKIETLRAKIGALGRPNDHDDEIAALRSRISDLETNIERWRFRIQGAAVVIGGSIGIMAALLCLESVRGSIFSTLFPTEKRFTDVATLMREPQQGLQEPLQLEEARSTLTKSVFNRSEAEAGIMMALAKYGEAAADDKPSDSEKDRTALALYKEAVGEHLFDYLDRSRRSLVVGLFTRPQEHSREKLIEATLSAGREPFIAKLEGIGAPEPAFKCGGSFSHAELAVEIALRPDVYDQFVKSETLQFLDCRNRDLPRVIVSISTDNAQIQRVSVRGVVKGIYDKAYGNPIYTVRATDAVMSTLGLSRRLEQTASTAFFIQDAVYEGTIVASRN